MKMTRTVPAMACLLILAGLVGCKKDCTTTIIQANKVDTTGLVVKLLFNGNYLDSTPYNNTPQVYFCNPTKDRFGMQNNAVTFDGTNSYMQISNSPSTDLRNSFTISTWIKPDYYPNNLTGIVWHGNADRDKDPYVLYFKNNSSGSTNLSLRKDVDLGSTYNEIIAPSDIWFAKIWTHIVGTYDHTTSIMKMYINGELVFQSQPFSTNIINYPTASFWTVIGGFDTNSGKFKGAIDDVYIFNRAISSAEVKTLFQN
jgi:Concanavalin A-like lectin/glucanases superfamily